MLSKWTIGIVSLAVVSAAALAMWRDAAANSPAMTAPLSAAFEASADFQFEPPEPGSYTLYKIKSAPDGTVLDQHGTAHRLRDITTGKLSLVSFVYLNCGDINGCPLAMATLFDIFHTSEKIPGLRDDLQLVTISFDPERDTPEALGSFAFPITQDAHADQKLDWRVLTTSGQSALEPILAGYGQVVDRSPNQEQINHLLRLFLVDRDGQIRNIYGLGQIDPRLLMTDVETLLMAERQR